MSNLYKGLLVFLLYFLCFSQTLKWIMLSFLEHSTDEKILSILLLAGALFFIVKNKAHFQFSFSGSSLIKVLIILFLNLLNTWFFHINAISGICFLLGIYFLSEFYLPKQLFKKSFLIVLLLIFILPIKDHLQTFLGFPLRLYTADVVSKIYNILGYNTISNSTILTIENTFTGIDYACSGVKSIYSGTLFMLGLYFIKNSRFSMQLFFNSCVFYLSLAFFNIVRIFILIGFFNILNQPLIADKIHSALGIIGFILSCVILYFLNEKINKNSKLEIKKNILNFKYQYLLPAIFLLFFLLSFISFNKTHTIQAKPIPDFSKINLEKINLTLKEEKFFKQHKEVLAQKYKGKNFTLLITASNNWMFQHKPERCLKGSGYEIKKIDIVKIKRYYLKKLTLKNETYVFYCFYDGNKTLADYSQRVWEGILNPKKNWYLIVFASKNNLNEDIYNNVLNILN